jgi:phosphopantothenate-cysteine ligase
VTEAGSAADAEAALRSILGANRVDAVIHSMAVSDYRPYRVSSAALIAAMAADVSLEAGFAALTREERAARFERALASPPALPAGEPALPETGGKIASGGKNLAIFLENTPKLIALFGELAPRALVVGFKLLDHAGYDRLIGEARRLLTANRCAFVLANDTAEMSGGAHTGYLVDAGGNVRRFEGKAAIARGITERVCAELAKRSV